MKRLSFVLLSLVLKTDPKVSGAENTGLVSSCLHLAGCTLISATRYLRQGLLSHFPNSPQIPEGGSKS